MLDLPAGPKDGKVGSLATPTSFRVKCGVVKLVELLKRHDGKTLEYKRDLSSPEGILKTLVAFANTAGGTIVVGVEDGSKNVRGVPDVLRSEEKLANLVSDSIRPRLIPDIDVVPWRNLNILAVQVFPSNTRPHYLERLGPEEGVFVRVGSTNRKAEALQIEELKSLKRRTTFDEQAIPDLESEAIDFRAATELLAPYRQLTPSHGARCGSGRSTRAVRCQPSEGCSFSARTGSPSSRMRGSKRAALPEPIEHAFSIPRRFARPCRAPRKKRLLSPTST